MDFKFVEELLDLTLIGAPKHQFPRKRPVHSFGIAAHGHFRGSTHAQKYCGAEMFSAGPTPTVVRFSNSAGQNNPEAEPQIRGMAVKFFSHAPLDFLDRGTYHMMDPTLADQNIEEVDLICTGLPNFFAATPEPLVGLFKALNPQKVKQPSRLQRLLAALRLNPLPEPAVHVTESADAAVLKWAKDHSQSHAAVASLGLNATQPPPASFGRLSYNAVHAFNIVGNDGSQHVARFSFEPVQGVRDASRSSDPDSEENYDHLGPRYLTQELAQRLAWGWTSDNSLRFTLRMTLADPWDDPSDPTVIWPSTRRQVIMGTLDLRDLYEESRRPDEVPPDEELGPDQVWTDSINSGEKLSFNPGRLPFDHMSPIKEDELMKARIAVYQLSQARRGATCPLGNSPGLVELLWPGLEITG